MHGYSPRRNIITKYNKYQIAKSFKGKRKTFGTYNTLHEALIARNTLIFHNWNKEYAGIKRGKIRKGVDRYIYKVGKRYIIKKLNPDTHIQETYESGIKTYEEALKLRDWWESIGWNWEMIE